MATLDSTRLSLSPHSPLSLCLSPPHSRRIGPAQNTIGGPQHISGEGSTLSLSRHPTKQKQQRTLSHALTTRVSLHCSLSHTRRRSNLPRRLPLFSSRVHAHAANPGEERETEEKSLVFLLVVTSRSAAASLVAASIHTHTHTPQGTKKTQSTHRSRHGGTERQRYHTHTQTNHNRQRQAHRTGTHGGKRR